MVARLLKTIKKLIIGLTPGWALLAYHRLASDITAFLVGYPSHKMILIGITGTKGKTSTANFLHNILQAGGYKTGLISTANIKIGEAEKMNPYHMTMPGRGIQHLLMRDIYKAGCQICIVEVTSEGLKQNRHRGIWFDIAIFTNLTPEHLPSHNNSFEEYKAAKLKLSRAVEKRPTKIIDGQYQTRMIIANIDSPHYNDFTNFKVDRIISYGEKESANIHGKVDRVTEAGLDLTCNSLPYHSPIPGAFNLPNILAAIGTGEALGINRQQIQIGLTNTAIIPGRMEEIKNNLGFKVFVDYAHEKESMERVLKAGKSLIGKNGKVILILGAEGGGRDKSKRESMAKLADQLADFSIVANVDPYEDDPEEIATGIAKHFTDQTKVRIILDRREAIKTALATAKSGDVILITGKGAEQSMVIGGKTIAWDDRVVVAEELVTLNS